MQNNYQFERKFEMIILTVKKNEIILEHFFPNLDIKMISNFHEMCKTKF